MSDVSHRVGDREFRIWVDGRLSVGFADGVEGIDRGEGPAMTTTRVGDQDESLWRSRGRRW